MIQQVTTIVIANSKDPFILPATGAYRSVNKYWYKLVSSPSAFLIGILQREVDSMDEST